MIHQVGVLKVSVLKTSEKKGRSWLWGCLQIKGTENPIGFLLEYSYGFGGDLFWKDTDINSGEARASIIYLVSLFCFELPASNRRCPSWSLCQYLQLGCDVGEQVKSGQSRQSSCNACDTSVVSILRDGLCQDCFLARMGRWGLNQASTNALPCRAQSEYFRRHWSLHLCPGACGWGGLEGGSCWQQGEITQEAKKDPQMNSFSL